MSQSDAVLRLELRARLRALRLARGLSQAQLGSLLGVNQKRIARIEAAPDLASLGQIQRLVGLLGGSIDIVDTRAAEAGTVRASLQQGRGRPAAGAESTVSSKAVRGRRVVSTAGASPAGAAEEARPATNWSASWD